MKAVTIVIPVYNAFDATIDCINSVLSTIPRRGVDVCVIDDASPTGELRDHVPAHALQDDRLRLLRNKENLGFVGTCNRAMLMESKNDIILLNSDTIVTRGWVEKLQEAAYSRPNVGTVTPLTNNGTICSIPRFLENNQLPKGYTLEQFAQLVEERSPRLYVEAPTCVGFCTYIRRECLDEVGVFDPVFKQGYGEENDLSLRGKARGFVNLIDDKTFIYHRGNMSFKEMREALSAANTRILNDRYPSYEQSVALFCSSNPLALVHEAIWGSLVSRWLHTKARTVLHVLHNGPFFARRHELGGTELQVQSIIQSDTQSAHFSLTPGDGCVFLTAHHEIQDRTWTFPMAMVPAIIDKSLFDLVHLHHALGLPRSTLAEALQNHGNYVVSIHDYHLICGRLWLVDPDGSVCNGRSCGGSCGESSGVGEERRAVAEQVLRGARRVLAFSESSRRIIEDSIGDLPSLEVHHHGIESTERNPLPAPAIPTATTPFKVLCVGTYVPHKGSKFVEQCSKEIVEIEGVPIEWSFLGRCPSSKPPMIWHGEYQPLVLRDKLSEIGAHVALLAPQCQETYSITLDEIVWCGLPVICSPFGALPERVNAWGVGYVFDNTIQGLRDTMRHIIGDWGDFMKRMAMTHRAPIRNVSEVQVVYSARYEELCRGRASTVEELGSRISKSNLIQF